MADEVIYRHEYLTGFAMAEGESPMNVVAMAQNHGALEARVRVQGISADQTVLFDSGDAASLVEPHRAWFSFFEMLEVFEGPVGYRVRILTSSTNLILSVGDPNGIGVLDIPHGRPIIPFPYYGPNDFVVFTLHPRPPVVPPVGPIENA